MTAAADAATPARSRRPPNALWGAFLLVLGAWWLLGDLGLGRLEWAWAGPLALVVVGLGMLAGRRGRCVGWGDRQ